MHCSAVLLAGGKSSRMGREKALLEIEGQPLWQRQLATLQALSAEQLMISGKPPAECECEIVTDEAVNSGPLGGVAAALRKCAAPLLVVLAIDLPLMTTEFLLSLLAECAPGRGMVPQNAQNFEPLAAVYPVECLSLASSCLREGQLGMQGFVRRALDRGWLRAKEIAPADLELFTNLNTPADYEKFREREIHSSR
jgi:molybdopterin-guanine dinucleotide biosynthesis protein A